MRAPTLLAISTLLSVACGSTDTQPVDSGTPDAAADAGVTLDSGPSDSGASNDAGHTPDAGSGDTGAGRDVGPRDVGSVDAGPGSENLVGTSLEGIQIQWNGALELCSSWRESRTFQQELDQKIHVTIPPHFRASLGDGHLAAATLEAGVARRSPFGADHHDLAGVSSTLTEYELRDPEGDTSLSAVIRHDLGAAGALQESYNVPSRRPSSFVTITQSTCRERLRFDVTKQRVEFTERMQPVDDGDGVVIHDFDGRYWVARGDGAVREVVPAEVQVILAERLRSFDAGRKDAVFSSWIRARLPDLEPGTYFGRFTVAPELDDHGAAFDERTSMHVVHGRLDPKDVIR